MELEVYKEEKHYHLLEEWAYAVAQVAPPAVVLPIGVVATEEGIPMCCGFLYESINTPVSVIEWVYFNPDASARQKIKAENTVLDFLESEAVDRDCPFIMTGSNCTGIVKLLEKRGFKAVLNGATHLVKLMEK